MKNQKDGSSNIPILGFGTWQLQGKICQAAVETALKVGFRHIDTADAYGNHREVGQAIKNSGLARKDLFLTTKVWYTNLNHNAVIDSGTRFLTELQVEYIDLLLIHWPNPNIPIEETLTAMNELKTKGLVKAIGVSNFTIHHLEDALKNKVEIATNQVELHPTMSQPEMQKFCEDNNIALTAYSPIGQGLDLKLPLIQTFAQKYKKTPSQVILNWLILKNIIAIPRSSKPEHIADNFGALNWQLSVEDLKQMDGLNRNNRLSAPSFSHFDY